MITNCNTCGSAYEVSSTEEADRPDRKCDACFYQDTQYRIDNVYPDVDPHCTAFLMYLGNRHRRQGLGFGLAECVGCVEYDRAAKMWTVSINVPYDRETDSDSREIGSYEDRSIALRVLWAVRHQADWG